MVASLNTIKSQRKNCFAVFHEILYLWNRSCSLFQYFLLRCKCSFISLAPTFMLTMVTSFTLFPERKWECANYILHLLDQTENSMTQGITVFEILLEYLLFKLL